MVISRHFWGHKKDFTISHTCSLDPTKEVGDHQTQEEAKEMATKVGELRTKQWPIENDTPSHFLGPGF